MGVSNLRNHTKICCMYKYFLFFFLFSIFTNTGKHSTGIENTGFTNCQFGYGKVTGNKEMST